MPVPMPMSVNMFRWPVRKLSHIRWKNGHPPQSTTGVASSSSSQPCAAGETKRWTRCPGTIAPMARRRRGTVRASETRKRRVMSSSSGFLSAARVTVRGSRAMPQIRQGPGFVSTTSGSIGQTNSTRSPDAATDAAGAGPGAPIAAIEGPAFSQCSGSAVNRSRQRGLQNQYVFPPCSCEPPRAVAGSTFIPHTGSVASFTEPGRPRVIFIPPSLMVPPSVREAPHHVEELVHLRLLLDRVAAADGLGHAVLDVLAQDGLLDPSERGPRRADLREDVHAVALFLHHADEAADLALDPPESLELSGVAGVGVLHGIYHTLVWYHGPARFEAMERKMGVSY